jgi:hypothetical protein
MASTATAAASSSASARDSRSRTISIPQSRPTPRTWPTIWKLPSSGEAAAEQLAELGRSSEQVLVLNHVEVREGDGALKRITLVRGCLKKAACACLLGERRRSEHGGER